MTVQLQPEAVRYLCVLAAWFGIRMPLGVALFVTCLRILWWTHVDLGENFSVRVEIRESHSLVTDGIYAATRHPIYTHHLLFSLAQLLVLHNGVVAGFSIASCLLVYFVRIPAEEKALVDEFGESYRAYMRRTGRVLPRPAWFLTSRSR